MTTRPLGRSGLIGSQPVGQLLSSGEFVNGFYTLFIRGKGLRVLHLLVRLIWDLWQGFVASWAGHSGIGSW